MIQKEVAERIAAGPGSKTYGILSVLMTSMVQSGVLVYGTRTCLQPTPKVKSAVIRMMRNETHDLGCDEKLFKQVVKPRSINDARLYELHKADTRQRLSTDGGRII